MKTLRASEITSYLYCQRAWWYQRQGIEADNQAEFASGQQLHRQHGRSVMVASCIQILAYVFMLVAFVLVAIYLTNLIL